MPGGLPAPNQNFQGTTGPEVGLIVRFDETDGEWKDQASPQRNWTNAVRFSLPDLDVFAIDANAPTPVETASFAHVGTILFNMAVNPASGRLYVSNSDAHNEVRFEGPGNSASTVRGHLGEARITVIDGSTVTPHHLNKHIEAQAQGYRTVPMPGGVAGDSLATPLGMAVSSDGQTLYVAAFGSAAVGVFDTGELESDSFTPSAADHIGLTGGGPSGLALDEANDRLYVFTRFDNSISVIDTTTRAEIGHLPVYNPEPASIVDGRRFLYDARLTSSNGEASCSSCHIFADFDSLAWDLGNPDDIVRSNPNPGVGGSVPFGAAPFHPMKGPMTTQTLRGLANHGPMHWRGDRTGAYSAPNIEPSSGAFDENAAFTAFQVAFDGLLGRDAGPLTAADMQAFTDFILQVTLPPNPIRDLSNDLNPTQLLGQGVFTGPISDTVATCEGCHTLNASQGFFGTGGRSTFENETQEFKVAHLRNLYQKIGMFGLPDTGQIIPGNNGDQGPQVRGFGFLHDGSVDTVFRFHRAVVFFSLNDTERRQLESFMFAFDSTLAPIVGQQITLSSTNGATVGPRIDLLVDSAEDAFVLIGVPGAHECDLIAKGFVDGEERGFVYDPAANLFDSDRDGETYTDAALRALVDTAAESLTYTCAPPGSGTRMGVDRDEDGYFDADETDAGSDPADPNSIPPGAPTPTPTPTLGASPTPTPTPLACNPTPQTGCRAAARGLLLMKNTSGGQKLVWKWLKGVQQLNAIDLGDPTAATDYTLCIYGGFPQPELRAPAGARWTATGSGYKYDDPSAASDGVRKVLLKYGVAGKPKVLVKGQGSALPLPGLALFPPITVQLNNSVGECFEGVFSTVLRNDSQHFKAKF